MRLESVQVIGRPPEEVFDFLADARNEVHWNAWARRIEKLSDGPVGRGTRFHGSRLQRVGEDMQVEEVSRQAQAGDEIGALRRFALPQ